MRNLETCPTKLRLAADYDAARDLYAAAVSELRKNIGICALDRYNLIHDRAEQARQAMIDAKAKHISHVSAHRC